CHLTVTISSLSSLHRPPQTSTLFPYTTLFRSDRQVYVLRIGTHPGPAPPALARSLLLGNAYPNAPARSRPCQLTHQLGIGGVHRSEEHTSELQSRENLVCRLLLEQKKRRTCRE